MISCLIIDNDNDTVQKIRTVGLDFMEITFNSIKEDQENALNIILKNVPQIIFINIESQTINILEFLYDISKYIEDKSSFVALASSKDKAFKAYQYEFSNFLLKPLSELSIRKSFLRYKKNHPNTINKTICLKSYKDYQYLNLQDILYLKADNNTTDFYMQDGRVIGAYKTLKTFENILPQSFLRIHKSFIINRDRITRINYGKSMCIVNNEFKIPFTKTFIANIDLINSSLSKNTMITLN
ncbi:LytTR family DNA-binding domain-containing protein [Psychroserpens sp. AS72]|uniref:LytR/AlgR family response regulator transcription factor n=1 Tax=Psychroserpens sp. AS72 TaxID=3135775 RepID=UPI00316E88F4